MVQPMPKRLSGYAKLAKRTWEQVSEYVTESAKLYQADMEKRDRGT